MTRKIEDDGGIDLARRLECLQSFGRRRAVPEIG
eukprot:CAMPEP_0185618762 /NCGR_PEP_ID=MMETSP0436-20130131/48165_1 /TAXON_ID=626734 ORGANISM="Favella taraikaensis, Strain Fe Narragansett Bay" /NCGR_SAMPLE_ID=MMETSP0436 /ASSEMBLY_ACC=CAM_ASM_000390 /LENGTH=33 /DNA_ID= /DNA_START= /DNA_END= /DNA_ORIENTATION=